MSNRKEIDEYLERLWYMQEEAKNSFNDLVELIEGDYSPELVNELVSDGLVDVVQQTNSICLTKKGYDYARQIVRAHRLAERLLYDVMGRNIEEGACEFEHIVTLELVDSICILLGHPRECPHGLPIPEGECCKESIKTVKSQILHLDEMAIGQSARVAYINSSSDVHLHRLNTLQIRPGSVVKLHQKYPSYVIDCEGAAIAMDDEIAHSICVWTKDKKHDEVKKKTQKKGKFFGLSMKFKKKDK
ncbi:MAG: metal-dependent transcriptional regulator [Candidatus Magnetobacterium sp. LHC-1]|uniref:Metal-dependent transcriptional regulator n=1 Tax=Candidatus Magnetobacterium casense TaxID=1455061 RepID=A0ABS6RYM1_9BACT|nr:metal-dependent transcriptional regulator [Candidatus Magnetobacterium casensis]MBF0608679.1 metal-dependent transcriptional regulator [Nitrospirota bacterium]MBV6341742.1 metal-dependent transcriptional regulator [Candidatus Magnetobacterium casensis]